MIPRTSRDDYTAYDDDEHAPDAPLLDDAAPGSRWRGKGKQTQSSVWKQARAIALETLPTLLLTTVGTIITGELLEHVSTWRAMTSVNELIMIIPVMLNLKGNLEMNLSARLGTAANMGELDAPASRRALVLGNLALLQVQAALVSLVAAVFSFALSVVIREGDGTAPVPSDSARALRPPKPMSPGHLDSPLNEFLLVASSAMLATCLSAALLGSFMCALIVLCRRLGRDPDNIAPPLAACLGDLLTLTLFGLCASALLSVARTPLVPALVVGALAAAACACGLAVRRNKHVAPLLGQGWAPLFGAMVITSGSGLVLDAFVGRYSGYALLAVAFGGLPGGTGSILISRISTALHAASGPSTDTSNGYVTNAYVENGHSHPSSENGHSHLENAHAPAHPPPHDSTRVAALTLLLVALPVEVFFLGALRVLGWLETPFAFYVLALVFLSVAVALSLSLAHALTHLLWRRSFDPDMYALPVHSALMDLSGQLLLVSCFELARLFGLKVTAKKHKHATVR